MGQGRKTPIPTSTVVEKLRVQGFKTIESLELELGHVNVFIGANGSGKSNLLEAVSLLAAAAFGKIDAESLARRGCRSGGNFLPLFPHSKRRKILLEADGGGSCYHLELESPEVHAPQRKSWQFHREVWKDGKTTLVDRTPSPEEGDPQVGLAALKLAETPPSTPAAVFLKSLAGYSIYSPDTPILRGSPEDPQYRVPIGLSGGGLAQAVSELHATKKWTELKGEIHAAVKWFEDLLVIDRENTPLKKQGKEPLYVMLFLDRFLRLKEEGKEKEFFYHNGLHSISSVNEGILYQLFLGVLCLHPNSPSFFAIDNGDHGLNPLLAKHLVKSMCHWLLNDNRPRQLLMTTHNPSVLDGLPLTDDRVRLFTVDRDNKGVTNVRRFKVEEKHIEMAEKGWTLSRMWVNKLIGGVPDV